MKPLTLLVLSSPLNRSLRLLDRLPEQTSIAVGETPEAFENLIDDADAVLCFAAYGKLLQTLWPRLGNVRWVHSTAAGVEHVLFPELVASPIPLSNARGVFADSLGEFAAAAVLFFSKQLRQMVEAQEAGRWAEEIEVNWVRGTTVGIVGYGAIGRAVVDRLHPFGVRTLALRRDVTKAAEDPRIAAVYPPSGLDEMLPQCDYLVLAAPMTPDTKGMIGERELALLPPHAVVINIGRGAVVQEPALIAALEQKRILGAALDVFEQEPLPAGHPFYRMKNVLLSPHVADHTPGWADLSMEFFVENFERFHNGLPLENLVDKARGY